MKIINVITQMEAAGAQRVAVLLTEELISRGNDVELWFLFQKTPAYVDREYARVLEEKRPESVWRLCRMLIGMIGMVMRNREAAFVAHTFHCNVFVLLVAWLLRVKVRVAVQHNPVNEYSTFWRIADRICGTIGVYTTNVVVSEVVRKSCEKYSRRYRDRIVLIENGIRVSEPTMSREMACGAYDLPLSAPVLINVGRMEVQKHQVILMDILARVPEAYLIIVGDGRLRSSLLARAEETNCATRLRMTGEVSPEDIANVLTLGRLFLFPSLFEALPLAPIEAMYFGIPIVANDIAALSRLVSASPSEVAPGVLIRNNDVERWVAETNRLLSEPELLVRMGEAARRRAREFTVEAMADRYEYCWQNGDVGTKVDPSNADAAEDAAVPVL